MLPALLYTAKYSWIGDLMLLFRALLPMLFVIASPAWGQQKGPLVLAAASLQEAMTDAAKAWAGQRYAQPVIAFGASSALARQVEAGAPADLFVSADEQWMDYLAGRRLIRAESRAGHGSTFRFTIDRTYLPGPAPATDADVDAGDGPDGASRAA